MADPRFYDNRGPFTVAELCAGARLALPDAADAAAHVFDVAGLAQAGPAHLSFFGGGRIRADFLATKAGWCLVASGERSSPAGGATLIRTPAVPQAYAAVARLFYPEHEMHVRACRDAVHPTAKIGEGVVLAPGVVIGENAEIGDGTSIGANSVIGRGVTLGRNCQIGTHVGIAFTYVGDEVVVQSGAQIGGSGFGFASGPSGHVKLPQLGRVIIQDRAEIGANTAIDRGALADTVIGEGAKIDNLVQIGHNTTVGRHAVMAGHVGIAGSVTIGDFALLGGMAGVADHRAIGAGARVGGLSGVTRDLPGGRDYGGHPARPLKQWLREMAMLAKMARGDKQTSDE